MKHKLGTVVKHWFLLLVLSVTMMLSACGQKQEAEPTPTVAPTVTVTPVPTPTLTPEPTPDVQLLFDEFANELFVNEIALNTINLHYTLAYPENFGITEYEPTLGSFDLEEMKASYDAIRELKEELEGFAYEELTKEQQMTYDIIMDYIESELSVEDLILYTEILGPVTGYQAQLPVLLAEYKFRRAQDVEDYLALVSEVDELFVQIVEFEKEKSAAGLFMPDYAAEAIIDQCRQFIETPEENYMIDVFNTEIQTVEGLTEEQKQAYMDKNKELITTEIVTAYQTLIDGLEALKGTGTNEKGLYYYEDGVRYYEYLVHSLTGSGRDVYELLLETSNYVYKSLMDMQKIIATDPDVLNRFYSYEFCETEPDKILEDLIVKIQEDFPELPEVNYTIKYVHPSMQEHMSPAFYLTPPVDDTYNNVIYINEPYIDSDLYVTMAHEGYPGHLYQNVYTTSKNLPLVRNLFSNSGYSEGWATYVEHYAYGIGGIDENLAEVLRLNSIIILGIHAYVDMGIHYLGWEVEDVDNYLVSYGLGGEGVGQSMFEIMVEEPGNYLSYFIGYLEILHLRDAAEESWGENFSLKKFHEAVVSLGSAPFDVLEKAIRNYE